MSELAQLLELVYNAHRSFTTASGELRMWHDLELGEQARRELQEREEAGGGSTGSVVFYAPVGGDEAPPPPELVQRIRFWFEKPDRFREEYASGHPHGQDGYVAVRDGSRWWSYEPRTGGMSNEHEPEIGAGVGQQAEELLDPVDLLAGFELAIVGESELDGRRALEVRATERPVAHPSFHRFPPEGDESRYLIDVERGVVLRRAILLRNREFSTTELHELTFDEPIPEERFVLALPDGEEFASFGIHRPLVDVTPQEAAQRASFPVFVVPRLPGGQWRMTVIYVEPNERPPIHEAVHINYTRDDAQQHLTLTESPVGGEVPDWFGEPETVIRDGVSYLVTGGEKKAFGVPTTVQFMRDGTRLQVISEDLGLETLLDLAGELVEA